jgi:hypothetical protein
MYNFILTRLGNYRGNATVSGFALLLLAHYRHLTGFFTSLAAKAHGKLYIINIINKNLDRTAFKTRLFFSSS